MACTIENIKSVLCLYNLLGMLAGILLILSAMRVQTKGGVFEELLHAYVSTSSWTLVGVGVLVFLFSVFGYYATLKNNYWLLILYALLLFILVAAEVVILILVHANKYKAEDVLKKELTDRFKDYSNQKHSLDVMQHRLHCCGTDGPASWGTALPSSCCSSNSDACTKDIAYQDGCILKATDAMRSELSNLYIVGCIAIFIKASAFVLALCLARKIKQGGIARGYTVGSYHESETEAEA